MPLIFPCGFVAIALWSLVEHRFERYGVAGPAALTLAGAVLVFIDVDGFAEAAAGDAAEHVVELILAVLLFVDACEVRGGASAAKAGPSRGSCSSHCRCRCSRSSSAGSGCCRS